VRLAGTVIDNYSRGKNPSKTTTCTLAVSPSSPPSPPRASACLSAARAIVNSFVGPGKPFSLDPHSIYVLLTSADVNTPAGRSVRRLPLAGDAALARARGAGALEELAGAVEAAVEAAEGVGVAVGVVAGVGASVAAVEAEAAAAVAVGAEVAEVAAVEEAAAEEVELVGVALRRGSAPVVVSASSSSKPAAHS
ncbi:unnamed protein product, partial [Closterium sp. Naga37s-1]